MARDPFWNDPVEQVRRLQRRSQLSGPPEATDAAFDVNKVAARNDLSRTNPTPPRFGVDPSFYTPDRTMMQSLQAKGRNLKMDAARARQAGPPQRSDMSVSVRYPDGETVPFDPAMAMQPLPETDALALATDPSALSAGPAAGPQVSTRTIGGQQFFTGVGAHGEPVFSNISADDPLLYGANAGSPMSPQFQEFAKQNPGAADRYTEQLNQGMRRSEQRRAAEEVQAFEQALLMQMPDLPARNLEAQAKMLQAEAAAAQAGGTQADVNKNAEALSKLFGETVKRNRERGLGDAEAYNAAIIEHALSAAEQGIDPMQIGPVRAFAAEVQRSLQEGVDAPYTGIGSFLPGTDYTKAWDGGGTFQPYNPETGAPRALPDLQDYELLGKANPLLAGFGEYKVRRRGEDGRTGTVNLPAGMSPSDFERMMHILTSASAARER